MPLTRLGTALGSAFVFVTLAARAAEEPRPIAAHGAALASGRVRAPEGPIAGVGKRVTWSRAVSRIFQERCQTCHHSGDIAPFPLVSYADAYAHRLQIKIKTQSREMPPWHVDSACARFEGDPSLTEEEIGTIGRWVDAGAPEGDPAEGPAPLTFTGGWSLGEPDLVLPMPEAYTPDLSKGDVYRCFSLPSSPNEDRWVNGVEVLPGVRGMVHHVLLFIDTAGAAAPLDAADPGAGWTCFGGPGFTPGDALGGWAPGNRPALLPEGVGILLPARSTVVMQVHYSAQSGILAPDVSSVGLHFSKTPAAKRLYTLPLANTSFKIPAGASDVAVRASLPFVPVGVRLLEITPHMHLLGRTMEVTATAPGGEKTCLVRVPSWDFHWQATYRYSDPVVLQPGSRIDLVATYDNSAGEKDVGWGEATTDEMCIAFLGFTLE
jgi:hypothetical protein